MSSMNVKPGEHAEKRFPPKEVVVVSGPFVRESVHTVELTNGP